MILFLFFLYLAITIVSYYLMFIDCESAIKIQPATIPANNMRIKLMTIAALTRRLSKLSMKDIINLISFILVVKSIK